MPELAKTPSFRLDGKRALVTGAGRGIGLAAVSALADAGAHVTLAARTSKEIEEAAKVDGATRFQIFRNIALPLTAPGLVVVALFTFIFAWNDFAYAVIFSGSNVTPLPVVIAQFAGGHEILWGQISAIALIAILPALVLATFLQKYLTRGLTMGAVK